MAPHPFLSPITQRYVENSTAAAWLPTHQEKTQTQGDSLGAGTSAHLGKVNIVATKKISFWLVWAQDSFEKLTTQLSP